jgi:Cu-processing system ATP-binding protein
VTSYRTEYQTEYPNKSSTGNPIELSNVTKSFGDVQAIKGVSLAVGRGEMFGLIGHNGAGKSTLFKMMLGLIPATSGEIRIGGAPINGRDFRQVRQRIGYLPESFVTYDNLTGIEVLHLFADLKKVPRTACIDVLERVGLTQVAERRVRTYSKGMRQRLGFAQVLLGDPELVFLDEPTNGLDPEGIHDFYEILRDVQARGCTIVITSHILAEIQGRVDRLVILNSGRIAAQGTLSELRAHMMLPSTIHAKLRAGYGRGLQGALAHLSRLELYIGEREVRIICAQPDKVAVLGVLSSLGDAVNDIAIHEPSLEDLFLGYGGPHGR